MLYLAACPFVGVVNELFGVKKHGINSATVMVVVGVSKKMAKISESWLCHNMDIFGLLILSAT
jgi:hypothetical protein